MYRIAHDEGQRTEFWGVTRQWVTQWHLDEGMTRAQEFATVEDAQAAANLIGVATRIVPVT